MPNFDVSQYDLVNLWRAQKLFEMVRRAQAIAETDSASCPIPIDDTHHTLAWAMGIAT